MNTNLQPRQPTNIYIYQAAGSNDRPGNGTAMPGPTLGPGPMIVLGWRCFRSLLKPTYIYYIEAKC